MKGTTDMREQGSIQRIIRSYDDWIIRTYCIIRFQIIRPRMLEEISQYFPAKGKILDLGCGFGLFSLYFASRNKHWEFFGIDQNERRIRSAERSAAKLGLAHVHYRTGNVLDYRPKEKFAAAYMLDIVHHVPPETVPKLLRKIHASLPKGGVLVIKDVSDRPAWKRWFTYLLDKLMDYKTPVHYWPEAELKALLEEVGFTVYIHPILDYLPYPHVLYACFRK